VDPKGLELAQRIGGEGWDRAKALWGRLRRKKNVELATQAAAALPDNQALRDALRQGVARALQEDSDLRNEVARLWGEAAVAGVTVIASSRRAPPLWLRSLQGPTGCMHAATVSPAGPGSPAAPTTTRSEAWDAESSERRVLFWNDAAILSLVLSRAACWPAAMPPGGSGSLIGTATVTQILCYANQQRPIDDP